MRIFKNFCIITVFIFSVFTAFAQPSKPPRPEDGPYKNFHGRRLPVDEKKFLPVFIKIHEDFREDFKRGDEKKDDFKRDDDKRRERDNPPDLEKAGVFFEIFFTQPVEAGSLKGDCIFVNDVPVSPEFIRFSKNCQSIGFFIPKDRLFSDKCSISIRHLISINGINIEDTRIENCHINCDYRYLERDNLWKKS